jgi:uncharacterized protein with beta-barrel porin domain
VTGTPLGISLAAGGSEGAVGNGATVTMPTFSGAIATSGALASGLVAQSIGGGGGYTGFTAPTGIGVGSDGLSFAVGGTGGAGGAGQAVSFTATGQVSTAGAGAYGLVGQSIGGGGGFAGFWSGGSQAPVISSTTLGATGGAGGDGGAVAMTTQAAISTKGTGAIGVLAQSIGGGGGVVEAFGVGASAPVLLGSAGGASGNGGAVNLTVNNQVSTTGNGAHAVVAQSVGGGGGIASLYSVDGAIIATPANAAAGGGGGNGGAVAVGVTGLVMTKGEGAYGVIAQSIGGGGGLAGAGYYKASAGATAFAGTAGAPGLGGTVDVNVTASVLTPGKGSTAIFADSDGGSGASNINVTIGAVNVLGGTGDGHAVSLLGGATNTVTTAGFLSTVDGLPGFVITGGVGNDNILNDYFVTGSVDLDGGLNTFHNRTTGVFISGPIVNLGAPGLLINDGVLLPGDWFNVFTTNVTGSITQTASGILGTDLELSNQTADRVNATGTGNLSGKTRINILNPGLAQTGSHDVTILQAASGVTSHDGLEVAAEQSAVITYGLKYPNSTDVVLNYVIDFSPKGLTENQHSVGNAVNAIQFDRTSPNFVKIAAALFYQPDVATLGRTYDSISGEGVTASVQSAFTANDRFMTSVGRQMGFWLNDITDDGSSISVRPLAYAPEANRPVFGKANAAAAAPRTWRVWGSGFTGNIQQNGNATIGTASMNGRGWGFAGGLDYQVTPNAIVGIAGGGGPSAFSVNGRNTAGTVDAGHIAAYGAIRGSQAYLTGILSYDFFNGNETRFAAIPGRILTPLPGTNAVPPAVGGFFETLNGRFKGQSISGRSELGFRNHITSWLDMTPFVAVQFGSLGMGAFTETAFGGPSVIGLNFAAHDNSSVPTFLGAQFDTKMDFLGGVWSTWARFSWVHEFSPTRTTESSFISAPGYSFIIEGARAPKDAARVNIGTRLSILKRVDIFGSFDGDFSRSGSSYAASGGLHVSW